MASSTSPLPPQITAGYGRFVDFEEALQAKLILFGEAGDILADDTLPIPDYNEIPRPIRIVTRPAVAATALAAAINEELESELLYKMRVEDWRDLERKNAEKKKHYDLHAARLTAYLDQSCSRELKTSRNLNGAAYKALFKAKGLEDFTRL